MPEKNTNFKMASSSKCACCPYGFHIDRDFVRFCDTLYNTGQLDKLRQHKRERRKEKKSVESYLGIGCVSLIEDNRNYNGNKKTSTLPHDFYLHNDGLNDAVNDFEDTWQRSLKKSSSSIDVGEKQKKFNTQCNKISEHVCKEQKKDESFNLSMPDTISSSSDSSQSATLNSFSTFNGSTSSEILTSMTYVHTSDSSKDATKSNMNLGILGSKIQKSALTTIREQMASSLTRLKELEEQVKCIPDLQVQLLNLTEEKKRLLNQLKFNQNGILNHKKVSKDNKLEIQLKRLENEGIMSPTITRKCLLTSEKENSLASPSLASNLESVISNKCITEDKIISNFKISDRESNNESKKILKNVGTSCSVLTRDIGIGYVPSKLKSIAVECDTLPNSNLSSYKNKHLDKYTDVSSESLESDLESCIGSEEYFKSSLSTNKNYSKSLQTKKHYRNFTDSYTSMNLSFAHKSTNTDTVSHVNSFQKISAKPLTRSKFVQVSCQKSFCNKISQTVSSITDSKSTSLRKSKVDMAVGDFDVNQTICSNCQKTKKSVGTGDFSLKNIYCEKCSILPLTNKSTVSVKTKTIGVGDFDINTFCQKCLIDLNEIPLHKEVISIGINTVENIPNPTNSDMHICDKCSAAIHSVARGLAANMSDSKIPKINVKSPVNKSNHVKLPKLKIPVYQSPKTEEKTDQNLNKLQIHSNSNKKHTSESHQEEVREESTLSITIQEKTDSYEQSSILDMTCVPRQKSEISKEIKAACKVFNDCLQKSNKGTEKKALSSLNIIQTEWFKVANQKNADPLLIEDYLDLFEEFSKLLLQRVVNLSDNNGNTALHYAVSYGNFDVVSILIDSKVCDVNKKNKAGYTSIMLVALADIKNDAHQYVVQRLFNIGDINIKASQNGQTALMLAVSHGKKDVAKLLLESGAEVNLQDKDGSTALMCAAEHGHLEIVKFLLSHPECDPTIMDNDNCTALAIAMEAGHKDIGLLIYTNLNFSRGSSPSRKRSTPRSTPPPRTPTLRTPPLPSPSARSTNSIPASFHFSTY